MEREEKKFYGRKIESMARTFVYPSFTLKATMMHLISRLHRHR